MRQRNQSGTTAASTTGILKATMNTECMNQDENTEILPARKHKKGRIFFLNIRNYLYFNNSNMLKKT